MTSKALYIGKFLVSGNDIVDGAVTFAELGTIYTSNLTEHVNLFFTNARARAAIQEQQAQIANLTARLSSLENK